MYESDANEGYVSINFEKWCWDASFLTNNYMYFEAEKKKFFSKGLNLFFYTRLMRTNELFPWNNFKCVIYSLLQTIVSRGEWL